MSPRKPGVDRNKVRGFHVPFLESNLTKVLKSSFIGNSAITFICNISTDFDDMNETINSLKFCARCQRLKNPIFNNFTIKDEQGSPSFGKSITKEGQVEKLTYRLSEAYNKIEDLKKVIDQQDLDIEKILTTSFRHGTIINPEGVTSETIQFYNHEIDYLEIPNMASAMKMLLVIRDRKDGEISEFKRELGLLNSMVEKLDSKIK